MRIAWIGVGEGGVGLAAAPQQGPDALDGVEVGCVGRQEVAGDPVVGVDELPQPAVSVDVQVVPHEHNRRAELLVGGDEQLAVVGPGETASAAPLVIDVSLGPVDQA